MMDDTRFAELAEAHGGDITRWPQAERAAALSYKAERPERAQAALAEAAAVDRALAACGPVQPPAGLEAAILARAPSNAPRWAGLAAGLALMIGTGAGWIAAPAGEPYAEPAFAQAFGALDSAEALDEIIPEDV